MSVAVAGDEHDEPATAATGMTNGTNEPVESPGPRPRPRHPGSPVPPTASDHGTAIVVVPAGFDAARDRSPERSARPRRARASSSASSAATSASTAATAARGPRSPRPPRLAARRDGGRPRPRRRPARAGSPGWPRPAPWACAMRCDQRRSDRDVGDLVAVGRLVAVRAERGARARRARRVRSSMDRSRSSIAAVEVLDRVDQLGVERVDELQGDVSGSATRTTTAPSPATICGDHLVLVRAVCHRWTVPCRSRLTLRAGRRSRRSLLHRRCSRADRARCRRPPRCRAPARTAVRARRPPGRSPSGIDGRRVVAPGRRRPRRGRTGDRGTAPIWSIITSSSGPQTAVWQNAGVATSSTNGPSADASATVTSWRWHGGLRVQIGVTPAGRPTVGVATAGMASPGPTKPPSDGSPAATTCTWLTIVA